MSKMYTAEVIADSISPEGHRITTVSVVYPHGVHKDMLRHRNQNRNVASFRAQPPEDLIELLRSGHAFKPDVFATRIKGMGQGEGIDDQEKASLMWDAYVESSCRLAEGFLRMNIAKQQVNFILQDLCPLAEIITATDWSNFFALRLDTNEDGTPVARPEVYKAVEAIKDAIDSSRPVELSHGLIHLPLLTDIELGYLCDARNEIQHDSVGMKAVENQWIGVSAGRCAKWSYGAFEWWKEDTAISFARSRGLLGAGHMSPFEQQARMFSHTRWSEICSIQAAIQLGPLPEREKAEMVHQLEYSGNMHGWIPARKDFRNEHDYGLIKAEM